MEHSYRTANNFDFYNAISREVVALIALWCESLQGRGRFEIAMAELAKCVGAEATALTRLTCLERCEGYSYIHDPARGQDRSPRLQRSFADVVLGPHMKQARPGSVWIKSTLDIGPSPELEYFHHHRKLRELVLIPLSIEAKSVDLLELHFQEYLRSGQQELITTCAPTFSESWERRRPGLLTKVLLDQQQNRSQPTMSVDLLGDANPAGLSRAEFRVCLLISRGWALKSVREQLGISDSTLRTHLRNIFAKTSTANQAQLIYKLLAPYHVRGPDYLGAA